MPSVDELFVEPHLSSMNDVCLTCPDLEYVGGLSICRYNPHCSKWKTLQRGQIPHLFKRGGRGVDEDVLRLAIEAQRRKLKGK